MLTLTKQQQAAVSEQPLDVAKVVEFFGTKKEAKRFLVDYAEARRDALVEERLGRQASDTAFGMLFWDGRLFLGSDETFDAFGAEVFSQDDYLEMFSDVAAYDEALDATVLLGRIHHMGRRFVAVRWEFQDNLEYAIDVWWLE